MLLSASFSAFHFSDFNFQHFTVTGLSAPPLKSGQIPAGSKHSVSLCAIKIRNQDFFASRDKRIDGGAMREVGREKGKWGQTSAGRWVRISNLRGRWTGKKKQVWGRSWADTRGEDWFGKMTERGEENEDCHVPPPPLQLHVSPKPQLIHNPQIIHTDALLHTEEWTSGKGRVSPCCSWQSIHFNIITLNDVNDKFTPWIDWSKTPRNCTLNRKHVL